MGRISDEMIEKIRSENEIVDIVSEYVQLTKQGRNYFGLCPFHDENSPSFSVSTEKQIFHCFGCGKGGNVITFMMEIENMNFVEALSHLGEKIGITIKKRQNTQSKPEDITGLEINRWLMRFYHHMLKHAKNGKDALKYLKNRKISKESIDTFNIGYAPTNAQFTIDFLNKKGYSNDELIKRNIFSETTNGNLTDRFSNRVIFPIRNHSGYTVAFGARSFDGKNPKYLNSPETTLFQKSKILYNFDLAKKHIRRKKEAVLCEGYIDVIACDAAGVKNSVATLGTAINEYQAQLLKRNADNVVICYDADEAGLEATKKAGLLLTKVGCNVTVARLEKGTDPDEYIQKYGASSFKNKVIHSSDTFHAFCIDFLKKDFNLNLEGDRIRYIEEVLNYLATIGNVIEREYYLKKLASQYHLTLEALQQQVHQIRKTKPKDSKSQNAFNESFINKQKNSELATITTLPPAYERAERYLIAYMFYDDFISKRVQDELGANFNIESHQVIVTYLYAYYEKIISSNDEKNIKKFIEQLPEKSLQNLATEILSLSIDESINQQVITDYIDVIKKQQTKHESIDQLKKEQRLAEADNNPIRAAQIAAQIIKLQAELKQ